MSEEKKLTAHELRQAAGDLYEKCHHMEGETIKTCVNALYQAADTLAICEKLREIVDRAKQIDLRIRASMFDKFHDLKRGVKVSSTKEIDGDYYRTFEDGNGDLIDGRTICDALNDVCEIQEMIGKMYESGKNEE